MSHPMVPLALAALVLGATVGLSAARAEERAFEPGVSIRALAADRLRVAVDQRPGEADLDQMIARLPAADARLGAALPATLALGEVDLPGLGPLGLSVARTASPVERVDVHVPAMLGGGILPGGAARYTGILRVAGGTPIARFQVFVGGADLWLVSTYQRSGAASFPGGHMTHVDTEPGALTLRRSTTAEVVVRSRAGDARVRHVRLTLP